METTGVGKNPGGEQIESRQRTDGGDPTPSKKGVRTDKQEKKRESPASAEEGRV